MKLITAVLSALLICGSLTSATAGEFRDYDFQQERMMLTNEAIFIISSFENEDHITAYNYFGTKLWNTRFHAKVVSWELAGNYIFVFSKSRSGFSTYLTCLDVFSGSVLWERP